MLSRPLRGRLTGVLNEIKSRDSNRHGTAIGYQPGVVFDRVSERIGCGRGRGVRIANRAVAVGRCSSISRSLHDRYGTEIQAALRIGVNRSHIDRDRCTRRYSCCVVTRDWRLIDGDSDGCRIRN